MFATLNPKTGDGSVIAQYRSHTRRKVILILCLIGLIVLLSVFSLMAGSYSLTIRETLSALLNPQSPGAGVVVWNIRLPRIVTAIIAGWALAISGTAIQCLLKNPLGSPFTLGISHGSAFGAAFAIVILGGVSQLQGAPITGEFSWLSLNTTKIYWITTCAFLGGLAATLAILALAGIKRMGADTIILAGVGLSSLFMSGTILLQYFATQIELATVVFWTFGDVSRSSWTEILVMFVTTSVASFYFFFRKWDLNALSGGEEVALGLGVDVSRFRIHGMLFTALVSSFVTAFLGIIAFLGLLAPHIGRLLVGGDHRFLLPTSAAVGAILLLGADTLGRSIFSSGTMPVGVLTSFMGAPLFLYLLIKGHGK